MPSPHDRGYEILEHTADAGIVARGATLAEAFAYAAEGMYALMVDPATLEEHTTRHLTLTASDAEHLLVAWLLELLFLTESEGLLFRHFHLTLDGETTLHGEAHGELLDPRRHDLRVAVKAVTYHLLALERTADGYRLRVLFDI